MRLDGHTAILLCLLVGLEVSAVPPARADPSILSLAVRAADRVAVTQMRAEQNLTWKSQQLVELTRLLTRAGRSEQALRLIRQTEADEGLKAPAFVPIALAAIHAGDLRRARAIAGQVAAIQDWTVPIALAEIAVALHRAGDSTGARRLIARIDDPWVRAGADLDTDRLDCVLRQARHVRSESWHLPTPQGPIWEEDYDKRQALLLRLVAAYVERGDRGDLVDARKALEALSEVPDRKLRAHRTQALLLLARRHVRGEPGESIAALHAAAEEAALISVQRFSDMDGTVSLQAEIAEAGARAGDRNFAAALLAKAATSIGPADDAETLEHGGALICRALVRLARAQLAVGQRAAALDLLERALRIADAMPGAPAAATAEKASVPAAPESTTAPAAKAHPASSWDEISPRLYDKVTARVRVAAGLEAAGEVARAASTLAAALTDLAAIPAANWRQDSWQAVATAYGDSVGLDRAAQILAGGPAVNPDKTTAITDLEPEAVLALGRDRLSDLLAAIPPSADKVIFAARLASRLAARGHDADSAAQAAQLVTDALGWIVQMAAALPDAAGSPRPGPSAAGDRAAANPDATNDLPGKRSEEWVAALVGLANDAPGVDVADGAERQRLVRTLAANPAFGAAAGPGAPPLSH